MGLPKQLRRVGPRRDGNYDTDYEPKPIELPMNLLEPQRECPRWERCSVNHCPLDPNQDDCQPHPLDKEQKCPMEKGVRFRIGSKYPDLLPMQGLTSREWAGKEAFNRLSPSDKAKRIESARSLIQRHNRSKQGKTT